MVIQPDDDEGGGSDVAVPPERLGDGPRLRWGLASNRLARPLTGWVQNAGLRRADTHGRGPQLLRASALSAAAHPARCCWRCGIERAFGTGLRVPFCAADRRQPAIGRVLDHRSGAAREVEGGLLSGSLDASQLSTSVL